MCITCFDISIGSESDVSLFLQVRQYADGVLVREEAVPREQLESILGKENPHIRRRYRRAKARAKVGELPQLYQPRWVRYLTSTSQVG